MKKKMILICFLFSIAQPLFAYNSAYICTFQLNSQNYCLNRQGTGAIKLNPNGFSYRKCKRLNVSSNKHVYDDYYKQPLIVFTKLCYASWKKINSLRSDSDKFVNIRIKLENLDLDMVDPIVWTENHLK